MKLVFRERDSQKARQLFEEAEQREMAGEKVVIITPNSRALKVKAQGYGFHLNIVLQEYKLKYNQRIYDFYHILHKLRYLFLH